MNFQYSVYLVGIHGQYNLHMIQVNINIKEYIYIYIHKMHNVLSNIITTMTVNNPGT